MSMKIPSLKKMSYPQRLLIEGASDAHAQLYSVIESFKDADLSYKHKKDDRSIAEIVSHALCCQYCWYTRELVLEKETQPCTCRAEKSVVKTLKNIQQNQKRVAQTWKQISQKELQKEFKTEWGQVMTKELALFQSVEHMMYHVGEICYIAGLGGFYKGTLG